MQKLSDLLPASNEEIKAADTGGDLPEDCGMYTIEQAIAMQKPVPEPELVEMLETLDACIAEELQEAANFTAAVERGEVTPIMEKFPAPKAFNKNGVGTYHPQKSLNKIPPTTIVLDDDDEDDFKPGYSDEEE